MTDIDENVTPAPAPDVNPQNVDAELSPEDFFVLSRVDGSMNISQICKTSGLGADKTMGCIQRLHEHGLIDLPGISTPAADDTSSESISSDTTSDNEQATESRSGGTSSSDDLSQQIRQRFPKPASELQFDDQLMEQRVELDDPFKLELIVVSHQLDDVDHYQLLGVEPDVEHRDLRKAYFRMSKRYHPDRFYQKILGDFESMVESIFQRVTQAYQTLNNDRKRQEYDATLQSRGDHSGGHSASPRNATPASQRSETREAIKGERKQEMAFRVMVQRSDKALDDGRVAEAIRGYRKALSLRREAELAMRVARALLERGEHLDDATSFARAAQKIEESPVEALTLIGAIYEAKGAVDDALYHYEMALEAGDDDNTELNERIARLQRH